MRTCDCNIGAMGSRLFSAERVFLGEPTRNLTLKALRVGEGNTLITAGDAEIKESDLVFSRGGSDVPLPDPQLNRFLAEHGVLPEVSASLRAQRPKGDSREIS